MPENYSAFINEHKRRSLDSEDNVLFIRHVPLDERGDVIVTITQGISDQSHRSRTLFGPINQFDLRP
jgi:hypothetical protein